jgi:hypothetical protein
MRRHVSRVPQKLSCMSAPDGQGYPAVCGGWHAGVGDIESEVAATRQCKKDCERRQPRIYWFAPERQNGNSGLNLEASLP